MCDADGRATTGPVYCAGVFQCFGDIGINHPPMNSGVISLNSPWLPLYFQLTVVLRYRNICCPLSAITGIHHMNTALSAHAHEVLHQFLYIYIYIYILDIYVHEKPFCEERNIVDIVDPSSLRRTSHLGEEIRIPPRTQLILQN